MAPQPAARLNAAGASSRPLSNRRSHQRPNVASTTCLAFLVVSLLVVTSPPQHNLTGHGPPLPAEAPPTSPSPSSRGSLSTPTPFPSFRFPSAVVVADASFWRKRSEALFCGEEECYGLLGLRVGAHPSNIKQAYQLLTRQLAVPTQKEAPETEEEAGASNEEKEKEKEEGDEGGKEKRPTLTEEERAERLRKIELAFSVLRSARLRAAYSAFLEDPDSFLTFLSSFRRAHERLTSTLSALLLILIFASVAQMIHHSYNLKNKLNALKSSDAFQKDVRRVTEERHGSKIRKLPPKEEEKLRDEIAAELADVWAEENGELLTELATSDLVIIQFFLLPVYFFRYIHFYVRWFWVFGICGAPYGEVEKTYLTRKALKISASEWAGLKSADTQRYMSLELWDKEKLRIYEEEKKDKDREARIQSGKYRQQKRRARKGAAPFNYNED